MNSRESQSTDADLADDDKGEPSSTLLPHSNKRCKVKNATGGCKSQTVASNVEGPATVGKRDREV